MHDRAGKAFLMAIRIEVQPDGQIEIQRPRPITGKSRFVTCVSMDAAMRIIRFMLKRDLERARLERFVSQQELEAKKALKTLEQRNPYNGKS